MASETGVLPGLRLWTVRRVDLVGQTLWEGSTFDERQAGAWYEAQIDSINRVSGGAVYLVRDGETEGAVHVRPEIEEVADEA